MRLISTTAFPKFVAWKPVLSIASIMPEIETPLLKS